MGDERKTSRWWRSLHKAGLIDEVQDSWSLPDDVSITKAKIVVIGEAPTPDGKTAVPGGKAAVSEDDTDRLQAADRMRLKIRECFEVGDYSGCLELAEPLLKESSDDEEVTRWLQKCRSVLMQIYESRIGAFNRVPRKAVTEEELIWRNLDPLTGFIAASVDGVMTFEDIIDISTAPRFETCRILNQLLQDGIIA